MNKDTRKDKLKPVIRTVIVFILFFIATMSVWSLLSNIATGQGR